MFRMLVRLIADPALSNPSATPNGDSVSTVFATHPAQLSRWLEEVWAAGGIAAWPGMTTHPLRTPVDIVSRLRLPDGLRSGTLRSGVAPAAGAIPPAPAAVPSEFTGGPALGTNVGPLPWEHLLYAYLVESTGIVEIFSEIVRRYVVGETLTPPTAETLAWVRATEELFFRDPPLFHVGSVVSQLRPDAQINRRNAYWRMFGCDLPHGLSGRVEGQPWKRDAGAAANTRFLELWNELLRQVWLGVENDRNQVGANPTDQNYVAYICQTLGELLRARRRGGMLAREEYAYVTMMSWFHLTVEYDTELVTTLGAAAGAAGNAADRLSTIGGLVGIRPPRQTRELFELADIVSPLVWMIEQQKFDDPANAELLFRSFGGPMRPIPTTMMRIIDLWQSATGERVKDSATTARPAPGTLAGTTPQPLRLPSLNATAITPARVAASPNGHGPVA
ncbi:hypothetical protein ACIA8O_02860 [Kitasatospora sp. NPDC051853]|uniref:hypothetical protein n=1 Tax=Kitasatospora sp. NPDC051853 TaxID=3364058 RepID=UPI0037A8B28C